MTSLAFAVTPRDLFFWATRLIIHVLDPSGETSRGSTRAIIQWNSVTGTHWHGAFHDIIITPGAADYWTINLTICKLPNWQERIDYKFPYRIYKLHLSFQASLTQIWILIYMPIMTLTAAGTLLSRVLDHVHAMFQVKDEDHLHIGGGWHTLHIKFETRINSKIYILVWDLDDLHSICTGSGGEQRSRNDVHRTGNLN